MRICKWMNGWNREDLEAADPEDVEEILKMMVEEIDARREESGEEPSVEL